eukprot:tig00021348_g20598.t1
MPWCVEAPEGGRLHVLLPKRTYVVGRKDCDIPLGGDACDKSVSRQHLKISIGNAPPETLQDPNARPSIFAEDTSKFGSSFDGVAVPKHAQLEIKDGTLNLGTGNTRARVFFTPLCFSTSLLNKEQQASLKAMCAEMGAALHANWKPGACVHHYLVMNELQVTTKVLSALLDAKPIVNVGRVQESTRSFVASHFARSSSSTAKSKAKRTAINVDELESKDGVVEAELVVVPPDPRTRNFKRFKKHAAAGQQPEFPRPVVRLTFFEEQKEEK